MLENATQETEIKSDSNSSEYDEKLKQENLFRFNIKQDHNCQFAALSKLMFKRDNMKEMIRTKICGQILRDRDYYLDMFPKKEKLDKYLENGWSYGCNSTFWGDELTLQAAADVYKNVLYVLRFDNEGILKYTTYKCKDRDISNLPYFFLFREGEKNYYPLVRKLPSYTESSAESPDPKEAPPAEEPEHFPNDYDALNVDYAKNDSFDSGPI